MTLRESKVVDKNIELIDGWKRGRIIDFDKHDVKLKSDKLAKLKKKLQLSAAKVERDSMIKSQTIKLYDGFMNGGYISIRAFHRSTDCGISIHTLTKRFRLYISEYSNKAIQRTSYKSN